MAGGEQKMISMKSKLQELSLDTQASDENEEETHSALLEYVFQRANRDNALSGDQARTFQNAQQDSGREEATPAAMVGRRLAELGKSTLEALIRTLLTALASYAQSYIQWSP